MSSKQCKIKDCDKFLKQLIVDLRPDADMCYEHHMKLVRKNPRSGMSAFSREKHGLV